MDPNTGSSASASGPKKDKKPKKNYEDGEGKKKFVSIPAGSTCCTLFFFMIVGSEMLLPTLQMLLCSSSELQSKTLPPYL